ATCDGAEPLDVQVCVLDFQRIKRPLDQLETAGKRIIALEKFYAAAQPLIPMVLAHSHHLGVKVSTAAAKTRHGHSESHHVWAIVRADHLTANLFRNHEHTQRNKVSIRKFPDIFL